MWKYKVKEYYEIDLAAEIFNSSSSYIRTVQLT